MRRRSASVLFAAAVVMTAFSTAAPAARAAVMCSLDTTTHALTVANPDGFTHVSASVRGHLIVSGVDCGRISQMDLVTIDTTGALDMHFGLKNPLGPGYTDEGDGSSELEFDLIGGGVAQVVVDGSNGPDDVTVGSSGAETGINLNAAADGATPDVDVTMAFADQPMIVLNGHGGDDVLRADGIGGGVGPDTGSVTINGGDGADTMHGGHGNDTIMMQDSSQDGSDIVAGGRGFDTLRFYVDPTTTATLVTVTLDGVANDGPACPGTTCDRDNIAPDIEQVAGSDQNEDIYAGSGRQVLDGSGGADILSGGPGRDVLNGAWGRDVLIGGRGSDTVNGDNEGDVLRGGPGNDRLDGGPGTDTCDQGPGTGPVIDCEQ